ncbi:MULTISPECIES: TRAP transporter substrate-binding protein [Pacificibacter]|uniref:TRAP transporter substrate-binding protein n=1 Tax=Pacificibacter TaxID=1042323 RepID=UPI001C09E7C8|nr:MULTISPECIES: TRAP transporter substrate-binding protein [Pacificibacter]MBU2937548.1 TRAP transporter substrate-binding protein [Pacificibacter marinus]MDO6616679.1 TRAP transporter substrate-binding protein [Pacificibacter sp. 1_MG-2023]
MNKITFALTALLLGTAAHAQDSLSVVGSWSGLPLHKNYEAPFWTTGLPDAVDGTLGVALTTHDQMGISGGDVFRMMSQGVFDVGMTAADYAVSDSAALEGLDVPLVASDANEAKAALDAARPMMNDIFETVFNAHVIGTAPYPAQIVFCNAPITGLADLEGLKVRASGRMTANVLEGLGSEAVTMAFGEVPGALQRGVIDCAVTGAGSGYSSGWWEVSTHLLPLALGGWDPVVAAIRLDRWNAMDAGIQETLITSFVEQIEEPAWAEAQANMSAEIACLTGGEECPLGETRDMTLVEATSADEELVKDLLITTILPEWSERAGGDWGQRWNDTVGVATGVSFVAN